MIADDPILGRVRLCSLCGEWWPDDEEFYYVPRGNYPSKGQCRACLLERREVYKAQRKANDRARYRVNLGRPLMPRMGRPRKDAA